jgi:hypothetical protein
MMSGGPAALRWQVKRVIDGLGRVQGFSMVRIPDVWQLSADDLEVFVYP